MEMTRRFVMTTGWKSVVLLTIVAQTVLSQMISPKDTRVTNMLPIQWRSIAVTNATADDVVKKLRDDGIRVCFEQNSATAGAVVSFVQDGSSTTDLLQKVVARLPGYTWHNPKGTDFAVVSPSGSSSLSWNVSALDATNRPFRDVLVTNDMLGLKQHDVFVFYRGFAQILEFPVNARFRNKPVIECLNELIVDRLGLCWTLVTNSRGRKVLTFQCSAAHPLAIEGYWGDISISQQSTNSP